LDNSEHECFCVQTRIRDSRPKNKIARVI